MAMPASDWEETFRFLGHPRAADPERTVEPSVAQRQVTERSGHAAS